MTVAPPPGQIRALVLNTLQQLGARIFSEFHVEETVLLQDGRCLARSYRTDDFFAMWLIEVGLVQFYNGEGDMLLVINLLDDATPSKMAA